MAQQIVEWQCSGCKRVWLIACDAPPMQGPSALALGQYEFDCPTKDCDRRFSDDLLQHPNDEKRILQGLSFRPLRYREKGTDQWNEIPDDID